MLILNQHAEQFGVIVPECGLLKWGLLEFGRPGFALVSTIMEARNLVRQIESRCNPPAPCRIVKVQLVEDEVDSRTNPAPI